MMAKFRLNAWEEPAQSSSILIVPLPVSCHSFTGKELQQNYKILLNPLYCYFPKIKYCLLFLNNCQHFSQIQSKDIWPFYKTPVQLREISWHSDLSLLEPMSYHLNVLQSSLLH